MVRKGLIAPLVGALFLTPLWGLEVNKDLSVDISLVSVYQYADFSKNATGGMGKGSVATDIGLNFHPTEGDEVQITLSFAGGNGLKDTFGNKGFMFAPNADDLEDDLRDINGRNRDYLLEAWYRHTFKGEGFNLSLTGGIIDATAYIDDNAFANDETTQFMNDVFVNNPLAGLPSYDLGGVAELDIGSFSVRGLVMNSKTDEGRNYDYYSLQVGFSSDNRLGEGNYRVYYFRTSDDFSSKGGSYDHLEGVGLSLDQSVGEKLGLFARLGVNTNTSTGDLKGFYSGGLVFEEFPLKGELGLGYAYSDGNKDVSGLKDANTAEAYYKVPLSGEAELTFDLQWDREKYTDREVEAFTYGLRLGIFF